MGRYPAFRALRNPASISMDRISAMIISSYQSGILATL
jgi:hypothetical protein